MTVPTHPPGQLQKRTLSKVLWRLMPFLMVLYVINIFDRVNLSYVALDMRDELTISAVAYGALAAAFFIGYFFFEVPSNILLEKFGARSVISRIMVTWGIVTLATFFVTEYWQIYVLRLLMGVMEAGFFPGIIYYLSQWVPSAMRGRAVTYFFVGSQVGSAFAGPVTTFIMDHVSWLDISGWRWVFVLQGLPAVIFGVMAYFYLTNKPQDAKWLSSEEKSWLIQELETERKINKPESNGVLGAFRSLRVWHLAAIYLLFQCGTQGMSFWAPTVVRGFSEAFSNTTVGLILMVPPLLAIPVMLILGRHSDHVGERKYHALLPILIAICGITIVVASGDSVIMKIVGILVYGSSYPAFYGIYWTLPSTYLSGAQAAVGIAIINSSASASTFGANTVLGYLNESYGNTGVLTFIGACLLLSITFLLGIRVKPGTGTQKHQDSEIPGGDQASTHPEAEMDMPGRAKL